MKSLLASVRSVGGLDRVDHAVQLLEEEWRRHGDAPLERLWAEQKPRLEAEPGESVVLLAELVKTDLRCRFARGQTPTVGDYLEQFPELGDADSRVLSLIYEEFCLAEERGDRVDVEAFCARYPRWKDSLVSQLQYHHLFSQAAGVLPKSPPFPEAGDTFDVFQLVAPMGRGGTSRVFLARDLSLGGKQVVLKVSLDRGREPEAQGALEHAHIVPVNSVVFADDGMRGLSMPYRPGLPLDEVIRRVGPASGPRSAAAIWEALVRPASSDGERRPPDLPPEVCAAGPRGDGWEGFPVKGTYPQGAAWVVKVVAEALHYAHRHETFHRDVKPANILLTVHHGPQLLDFNLAESPHSASQAQAAMHGGTLPYMAPEQIEAFLNPELWGKVGAAADIYSLGLVLRELLTGQAPDLPPETLAPARAMRVLLDRRPLLDASVRQANPDIPHALEAIVARCLAVAVADRYPDAGVLAEDLGRFLRREPLAHAVNPSRRERSANWARRNRVRLAVAATCLACALGGIAADRSMRPAPPSVPIVENPALMMAVDSLKDGVSGKSRATLDRLASQYPRSGIPRIYLGLLYDSSDHPAEAEAHFRAGLDLPDAERELIAWSPGDPQLEARLRRFAENRFAKAEVIEKARKLVEAGEGPTLTEQYRLAFAAHEMIHGIRERSRGTDPGAGPDLPDFDRARAAQEVGRYDLVIESAGDAIRRILDDEPRAGPADRARLLRQVYDWRRLRARALTKSAERRRAEGSKAALDEALGLLGDAEKDLESCRVYTANWKGRTEVPDTFAEQRIRLAACLMKAEIQIDQGALKAARSHWNAAREAYDRYVALAQNVGDTRDIDARYRQINAIDHRLRQAEAGRAGGDRTASVRTR